MAGAVAGGVVGGVAGEVTSMATPGSALLPGPHASSPSTRHTLQGAVLLFPQFPSHHSSSPPIAFAAYSILLHCCHPIQTWSRSYPVPSLSTPPPPPRCPSTTLSEHHVMVILLHFGGDWTRGGRGGVHQPNLSPLLTKQALVLRPHSAHKGLDFLSDCRQTCLK